MKRIFIASVVCAALMPACGDDFDDVSTIKDLRCLAIVAEPPEVFVDPANPMPPAEVKLRPLVLDPRNPGQALSVRVLACPGPSARAPMTGGGGGGPMGGAATSPCDPATSDVLFEGDAQPDAIAIDFAPSTALIVATLAADPLSRVYGASVKVEFTFKSGEEELVAFKQVIYSFKLRDDHAPNTNPVIPAVTTYENLGDAKVPLDEGVPRPIAVGGKIKIEPGTGPAEGYPKLIIDTTTNKPAIRDIPEETLRFNFFTTLGKFSPAQTTNELEPFIEDPVIHLESSYEAPDTAQAGTPVTIWIVVRDERGGTSWTTRSLVVQ